jgi:hypothetical protein
MVGMEVVMTYFVDLSGDYLSSFAGIREMWGEVGFVCYSVNSTDGPSLSYMMVL